MSQPRPLDRREVLQTAAVLGMGLGAISILDAQQPAGGETRLFGTDSGLITGRPKPLPYQELPGLLTRAQITPHYQAHYGGALNRYNTVEQAIERLEQGRDPLGGDAFTFLQRDRLNRMNSVLLHELYFDNLRPQPPEPPQTIREAITRRFGSVERWTEEFKACCMAAQGWGILARDLVNGKLYNVISDLHENGVIWLGQPLIVCDVYEHAFYVDYQNRKQEYVNRFVQFLNWEEINRRWLILNR